MEIKKQYLKAKPECKVTFKAGKDIVNGAQAASIAGVFNDWSVESHPMKILKTGEASASINLETGKEYQYKFVFDNQRWENDPSADNLTTNEFGEKNSIVIV